MKPVILAEKPSQAKAYADAFKVKKQEGYFDVQPCDVFPEGAYITWGIGHLVELKDPKSHNPMWTKWSLQSLPILPEKFQFQIAKGKAKQFGVIKKLIYGTDTVINACDVDREGSNIFYSIYEFTQAQNKTIKRLWINSLEVDEVRKGFLQLQDNQKDLLMYEEAKARQMSDWLVGMNGSRLYTLLIQKKGIREVFSIGRVQSPTVYLIYQRALEIERFVPELFFEIECTFKAENGTYKGKVKGKLKVHEEAQDLLRKHQIDGTSKGTVKKIKTEAKKILPPKLHALSTKLLRTGSGSIVLQKFCLLCRFCTKRNLSPIQGLILNLLHQMNLSILKTKLKPISRLSSNLLMLLLESRINVMSTVKKFKNTMLSFQQRKFLATVF